MSWLVSMRFWPRYSVPNPVNTPQDHPFTPEEDFFGSEYVDAPEEDSSLRDPIAALPAWCSACSGSECQRCVAVCPTHAITLDPASGPRIDEARCTRCGLCAGICDAFISTRSTLADLHKRVIRNAQIEGCVYFTCPDQLTPGIQPRDNVIVLPCLAAVPPEFWAAVMAEDLTVNIYCDFTSCHECTRAGSRAVALFEYALHTAQAWMEGRVCSCTALPEKGKVLDTLSHIDENDRRSLFSVLAHEGKDIASGQHRKRNSGATAKFHEQQDRLRAEGRIQSASLDFSSRTFDTPNPLNPVFVQKHPWDRQALLVEAIHKNPERAEHITRYSTATDGLRCSHAYHCVSACLTGARSISSETGDIYTDPTLCIACGACVATCPAQACHFVELTAQAYCSSHTPKG